MKHTNKLVLLAGMFEETDKCCREHDHCKETIASFSFDHGVFNTNIFTLSHCDCDNRYTSYHVSLYCQDFLLALHIHSIASYSVT